ncbi:hypothetical protein [Priestia megaterium]|jgi:hypothetical protein|nr:hypothetical protein [Priestia megaterium]MDI3092464.1 hypothetical protein [Priestia megaterium]MED3865199.1 hypothetical protein [Priestia megaterium]MED4100548.1 hypothetical protein [Priestia megaterium]MED4144401.1 hypothetical protein [Priestia megaterium]MED4165700.1 hypothetical protein [Priestia megaterium]
MKKVIGFALAVSILAVDTMFFGEMEKVSLSCQHIYLLCFFIMLYMGYYR